MPVDQRLLLRLLRDLREVNRFVPIIVEGKRDRDALRRLGFTGEIILLHTGRRLYEFSEDIARRHERVILLLDWDRRGTQLYQRLSHLLKGHHEEFSVFRNTLIRVCGEVIESVEEIPSVIEPEGLHDNR